MSRVPEIAESLTAAKALNVTHSVQGVPPTGCGVDVKRSVGSRAGELK